MRDRNVSDTTICANRTAHKEAAVTISRKNKLRVQLTGRCPANPRARLAAHQRIGWRSSGASQIAARTPALPACARAYLVLAAIPAFAVGAVIGLIVLGWWLFLVEWTQRRVVSECARKIRRWSSKSPPIWFAVDNNLPCAAGCDVLIRRTARPFCRDRQTAVSADDNNWRSAALRTLPGEYREPSRITAGRFHAPKIGLPHFDPRRIGGRVSLGQDFGRTGYRCGRRDRDRYDGHWFSWWATVVTDYRRAEKPG